MDQETAGGAEPQGEGAFAPTPMDDILRADAPAPRTEPAGRPEPEAATHASAETGEAAKAAPAPQGERPRDEAGRFAPKDAAAPDVGTGPPPAENVAPQQNIPPAVLLEERRKRQALEKEVQELRAARQPQQPAPPPPAPAQPPSHELIFSEPERYHRDMLAYQDARIAEVAQQQQARFFTSEEQIARTRWPDWDQAYAAVEAFAGSGQQNRTAVSAELNRATSPGEWTYRFGKQLLAQQQWAPVMQQYATPEAYAAAQRSAAPPATSHAPSAPPASLAGARSAPPTTVWGGPKPMSAILGRR